MSKILISALLAFVIGFFTNQFFFKTEPLDKDSAVTQCTDLNVAKSSLISISQNEYLEYAQIKDLKQKYEKADELLGKIMLLFLADVGFRLQKPAMIESSEANAVVASMPEQVATTAQIAPSNPVQVPQSNSTLAGKSSLIRTLSTEKQIREALDKAIIENPKIEIAKGETPTQKQVRVLEGRYSGIIKFLDGKRENLTVTWDLTPDYTKSGLSGTFSLSIHGPGKNSESNGRGDIDNIVGLAEDREGLLVSSCGDACYLQLYYNSQADQFYGNYYETIKDAKSNFVRLGLVELKK